MPVKSHELQVLCDEILNDGRGLSFRVRGPSMQPSIRDGDVVTVRPLTDGHLVIGDIILFKTVEGILVLHRLVRREYENGRVWLFTKGDSMPQVDRRVSPDQVIGRVTQVCRAGRFLVQKGRGVRVKHYLAAQFSLHRLRLRRAVRFLGLSRTLKWLRDRLNG